jgi:hypothetical protein
LALSAESNEMALILSEWVNGSTHTNVGECCVLYRTGQRNGTQKVAQDNRTYDVLLVIHFFAFQDIFTTNFYSFIAFGFSSKGKY